MRVRMDQEHRTNSGRTVRSEAAQVHPRSHTSQPSSARPWSEFAQTKLTIGQPGDRYEREADRVADHLAGSFQDKATPRSTEYVDAGPLLRRDPLPPVALGNTSVPEIVGDVLASSGEPLPSQTRAEMEPHFGHDFSQVRVHADKQAAESARQIGARAYTLGNNLVFGTHQYAPATPRGQRLLAHELTHVVQQQSGSKQQIQRDDKTVMERVQIPRETSSQTAAYVKYLISIPEDTARSIISGLTDLPFLHQVRNELARQEAPTPDAVERLRTLYNAVQTQIRQASKGKEAINREASARDTATASGRELVALAANEQFLPDQFGGAPPPLAGNVYGTAGSVLFGPAMQGATELNAALGQVATQGALSGSAFFQGLYAAIDESNLSDEQKHDLLVKFASSAALSPVVYAGVTEGIVQSSLDTLIGLMDLDEAIVAAFELADTVFSPGGEVIARELGRAAGKSLHQEVAALSALSPVKFAYRIGKLIAPLVVDIVLAVASGGASGGKKAADIARAAKLAEKSLGKSTTKPGKGIGKAKKTEGKRNRYPDFEDIPPTRMKTAQAMIQQLSKQLGIPLPKDRVLSAPWIGRVYDKAGSTRSVSTSMGYLRNESKFWTKWTSMFPDDAKLLGPRRTVSPELAKKYGWDQSNLPNVVGDKLVHHHIANGDFTVAIPESLHKKLSGKVHAKPTVVGE